MIVSHGTQRQPGLGLVELLIAMALGVVLIAGAVKVYQSSRAALRNAESLARLQDVARLAFDSIEADLRMAGYWGILGRADLITNRAGIGAPLPDEFTAAQGSRIDLCGGAGSRWAIDLDDYVDGADNVYGLACRPASAAQPDSDTLVLRRAMEMQPASLDPNRIHVQTDHQRGMLFVPSPDCTDPSDASCLPAGFVPGQSQSRVLIARAYYVASSSIQRPDVPALRRKSIGNVNAVHASDAATDEEIASGVEDLQVILGLDRDGDGGVDAHVSPGAVPPDAVVVAAAIRLRIRSEDREPADNAYRRIVVARTIRIRNAQP